ncbi:asparaginase domain-containing protein [Embleya sp. NPDC005575]|uniref:asparaginase domain-containing protein n=1 Tax=Embleya sp. NPDC005575 TaxID=3156892 RepID=UPI00339EB02B
MSAEGSSAGRRLPIVSAGATTHTTETIVPAGSRCAGPGHFEGRAVRFERSGHSVHPLPAGRSGPTHGTDTLEETACLADPVRPHEQPLVFPGARRDPTLAGPDRPAHLLAAARVASAPMSRVADRRRHRCTLKAAGFGAASDAHVPGFPGR